MKRIHVALSICLISACTVDDEAAEQTTTQELRPTPPFFGEMGLDGDCAHLNIFTNWTGTQDGQAFVSYTITDQRTGSVNIQTFPILDTATTDNHQFVDLLRPLPSGGHRFSLVTQLLDTNYQPIFTDPYRVRLPCELPAVTPD